MPLFVSRERLYRRCGLPRACAPWALDSSGFTQLSRNGRWTFSARQYAGEVRRFRDEIGMMEHAAAQDWMCEPHILKQTGLDVREHQIRTIASYVELRALDDSLPWMPVLQGWEREDYLRHVEMYDACGIDLRRASVVGLGSVCRRQATDEAADIIKDLAALGIRLHGFGLKRGGIDKARHRLVSADSMAWSVAGRWAPDAAHGHSSCSSCFEYALDWYARVVG